MSRSSSAASGLDAQTEVRDLRAENARLKAEFAGTEKERVELADKVRPFFLASFSPLYCPDLDSHPPALPDDLQLSHPASIPESSKQRAGSPLPPATAHSTSAVVDSLVKPYEAVFWALEAVGARLTDSDVDGGQRAVKRAREKLRAMGPLWEEVGRRKGLA